MGLEPLTYLKPYMTFTRPFKQSSRLNYESSADLRLRVLAMASGKFNRFLLVQLTNRNKVASFIEGEM